MCVWFWWNILVLSLRILISTIVMSLLWAPTPITAALVQSSQLLISQEKNPLKFCLHGLMFIVKYSVHHVKYKTTVTLHTENSNADFQLTPLPFIIRPEPLQNSAGQINNLLGPGPLYPASFYTSFQTAFCWPETVENCQPLIVISYYIHHGMFIYLNPFNWGVWDGQRHNTKWLVCHSEPKTSALLSYCKAKILGQ